LASHNRPYQQSPEMFFSEIRAFIKTTEHSESCNLHLQHL
jgi:hypothetical protein